MSSKKLGYRLVVLLVCVLACSSRAVEKPTSPQKTCVTEECHADYGKEAHVHAPVGLGLKTIPGSLSAREGTCASTAIWTRPPSKISTSR
ncbi:MAG: hypothetical protein ACYS8I_10055 [Planctomycetota bacterium]